MSICKPHTGLFDDFDNPLDEQGKPFMPGIRICLKSDCVEPTHQLSHHKKNERHYNKKYDPEVYAEIIRIGNLEPSRARTCRLEGCDQPRKARNLCAAHWSMFRHRQPSVVRRNNQMALTDFPPLDSPIGLSERSHIKPRNCNILDCPNRSRNRGLCKNHWERYKTAYKRETGKQWKSTQSA